MIGGKSAGNMVSVCAYCGNSHAPNQSCMSTGQINSVPQFFSVPKSNLTEPNSLEDFFVGVRSSCNEHAKRKGYTNQGADEGNVAGPVLDVLGVTQAHAVGEIALKLLEFQRAPRRVVAEKIAGWAWRLWCSCKED